RIDEAYPLLAVNLRNSTLAAVDANRLEIKVYGSQTNKTILSRDQSLENLKRVCSEFFKTDINVVITYTCDAQPEKPARPRPVAAGPDPLVSDALDIFGGKIVT
ncbi:MAG: hypothetical protein ACOZBW_07335, partial [Thermodesulfobacteriota bacterium]